jgi:Fungal specific transcription factor domain
LTLGLNNEKFYHSGDLTDDSKEIMRGTFWTVYMADRMLSALRFEPPMVKESDIGVTLPSLPGAVYHPQDNMNELQIAIMSSDEWYIPTPRNLSVNAYLLILVKIHGRIIAFSQEQKSDKKTVPNSDFLFRESALSASLRDWYAAIPEFVRNVLNQINNDKPPLDPVQTWHAAFIMILYYCIKIYLPKQSLLKNIEENIQLASSCSAAREIFLAGCNLADILQSFLKHNPEFLFVPPFVASCIFGTSLMTLIVSKLNLNPTDIIRARENLVIFSSCLHQHASLYNIGNAQKAILDRMMTCDNVTLLFFAIKNLRNMKGESVAAMSSDVLVASETDVLPMAYPTESSLYGDTMLLQSVAIMSNPYNDLMIGSGAENFFDFDLGTTRDLGS